MLSEDDKTFCTKIIDHCDRVSETISNKSQEDFLMSRDAQDIVLFNIFQIGEYAKRLSQETIETYNGLDWKNIKGMRDIIGHCYDSVDYDIVWDTAINDIPAIREYVKQMLQGK